MCCGKPTIAVTTMQECHDNIGPHNHNEYPLLYKEAKISVLRLGRFLECRKCNTYISYNTGTCAWPDVHHVYTYNR